MRKWLRFRFRLRTLLLAPLVFGAGWWWGTWPTRTVTKLNSLVAAGESEAAESLTVFSPDVRITPATVSIDLRAPFVAPLDRTWADLLLARQRYQLMANFDVTVQTGYKSESRAWESVTVERGLIKYKWSDSPQ